ncbi:16S rRNA (cytosine(1402)-N(4))-methyltransferase RsmH [Sulfidibacter corallicola]|uniref:Ribosomal RNA small subunit methyltransferase H n=1 Tax=Sulfidibacter corallicola TaxID=2818388 RepID=A0A8A4TET1_SULCO|nr:16S rRNA (cytosine(1402)-N(4))-methyltransferase RsmH [Sulfidibacter corallicola]QTD48050.1 16S rRNA (cytosine(1402)-N(4))-methyltransferase RsmH [Sulfidibacter corallicola]
MEQHIPVLMEEVLEGLAVRPDGTYWDGTFGGGGHSGRVLAQLGPDGRLHGSDRDDVAEARAGAFASDSRFSFHRGAIEDVIDLIPNGLAGFLWDLGTSMMQLKEADRGFSFKEDGPLDMRMDRRQETTAADLVNNLPEGELADLIYMYGEERLSRRIARQIVAARQEHPIETTGALAELCRRAYPKRYHRIDPATRTFQALRIAINNELDMLRHQLPRAAAKLAEGGRAVIISFHSLEDRIVKHTFRELSETGEFAVLTKKPRVAAEEESRLNPASRSAKLRVLERCIPGSEPRSKGRRRREAYRKKGAQP